MTQRLRRKSIRQPGPVKGDQTWAGVGWEDGNGEGVEERERWPRSGDCRNEGEGRREGGWRGLRCRRRAVRGRGQGRGGDNDTHQTHKSCGHRGACRHTQSLTPPTPHLDTLETGMGMCVEGLRASFRVSPTVIPSRYRPSF